MALRSHVFAAVAALVVATSGFAQTEYDVINAYNRGNDLKKALSYDEADREYQRSLYFAMRVYGEEHKNTALLLHAMGDLYERQGKLESAEAYYTRAVKSREKANGPDSLELADELASLAAVSMERGKGDAADKLLARALAIREKAKGEDSTEVADTLNELAVMASRRGKPDIAERLYRKSLIIRQKTDGPDSLAVAQSLSNLGLALHDLNRHQDAEDCHRRALTIREKAKGPDDPLVAESLNNLGLLLGDLGRFQEAEEQHRRALKIRTVALGAEHIRTASTVNNLAILCMNQGRYAEAGGLFRRTLATYEKAYGGQHTTIADTLRNLGQLEKQRGRFAEAELFHRRALAIDEKLYGVAHEAVAAKLNNLAALLEETGQPADAEAQYRRALKVREAAFGMEHELVAMSLINLAAVVGDRGRPAEARQLLERAHKVREKVFGSEHPAVSEAANLLAKVMIKAGDHKDAETLLKRNLGNFEKAFGKSHPAYADAIFNLAGCFLESNRFAEAEAAYRESLPLFERFLGPGHPHVGDVVSNLGNSLRGQGQIDAAREQHQRAREIMQRAFGLDAPAVLASLNNLALDAWLDGKPKDAAAIFDEQRKSARRYLLRELPFRPQAEQRAFLAESDGDLLARALHLGRDFAKDADTARKSAEWLANGKATALESRNMRAQLDRDVVDRETRQTLAEIIDLRTREIAIGQLENGAAAANVRKQRTEFWLRRRLLEQKMAATVGVPAWIELEAICKALPKDGLFVDFARFRPTRLSRKADESAWEDACYVAWVVRPTGEVTVVDLGDAANIDTAVQSARQLITSTAARSREIGETRAEQMTKAALGRLSEQILKPLTPHLKDVKKLTLSPDGDLWLVPWAALPYQGDGYLVESIVPRLVVSGRDVVRPATAKVETNAALVIADPDFNAAPVASPPWLTGTEAIGVLGDYEATFVFGEAGKLMVRIPEGDTIGRGHWEQFGDTVRMDTERSSYVGRIVGRELRGQRRIKDRPNAAPDSFALALEARFGSRLATNKQSRFTPQPLTRSEGESAAVHLKPITGNDARLLTDARASEAAIKSSPSPKVLVLSTHGFVLPAPKESPKANDPLSRCGLLLSGCNQRANAGPGQEDGILMGLEVVSLDLRGTELVVLSACDGGFEVATTGDAVAGLRQAFQLAGADDVLATLWPIPDSETGRLMGRFYERLSSGLSRAEVLAAAQREAIQDRRKRSAGSHPYYWAGLTITGRD